MRVRMKTHITGYRDGVEWPAVGGCLDVPDPEAEDLFAAGYAEPAAEEESHARRGRKDDDTGADGDTSAAADGDASTEPDGDGPPGTGDVDGDTTRPAGTGAVKRAPRAKKRH